MTTATTMDDSAFNKSLEKINALVNLLVKNVESSGIHNRIDETNTKAQFITPMFEALGWDVNNQNGKPGG